MKLLNLFMVFLLIPIVSAEISEVIENEDIQIKDLYCTPQGQTGFKLLPIRDFGEASITGILLKQADSNSFSAIEGVWDRQYIRWDEQNIFKTAEFTSYEAEIYNEGTHELRIFYELNNEEKQIDLLFDCPGTEFSCKLFDIHVDKCGSSEGVFTAEYTVTGFNSYKKYSQIPKYSIDDLTFVLVTEERYCDVEGNCGKSAGIPPEAKVEFTSDEKIKMTWNYETAVKGTSISLVPAQNCEKRDLEYEMKASDFKNCDADPYSEKFVCQGCEIGTLCVLEGEKIIQNGESLFCINSILSPQKKSGSSCDSNYECITNFCIAGVCADELLPECNQGILNEACKCGTENVRTWENKYCCNGKVSESTCPNTDESSIQQIDCEEGYKLINNQCVKIEENKGFWSKIGDFFKKIFSKRE